MGGGGQARGVLIYVHNGAQCVRGCDQLARIKGELEYCSTGVYPNYGYVQAQTTVREFRAPDKTLRTRGGATGCPEGCRSGQVATFVAGGLNKNTWRTGCREWLRDEDLWPLADPNGPTHRSGTVNDTMVLAAGSHMPAGVLSGETETVKGEGSVGYFPA